MQSKESSQESQAPRSGYRVERADLIGGRWSGGTGVAEARAAVGTRGVASLSGCSGADRGIGGRSVVDGDEERADEGTGLPWAKVEGHRAGVHLAGSGNPLPIVERRGWLQALPCRDLLAGSW